MTVRSRTFHGPSKASSQLNPITHFPNCSFKSNWSEKLVVDDVSIPQTSFTLEFAANAGYTSDSSN